MSFKVKPDRWLNLKNSLKIFTEQVWNNSIIQLYKKTTQVFIVVSLRNFQACKRNASSFKSQTWMMSIRKKNHWCMQLLYKISVSLSFFHTLYTYSHTESFIREGNVFPRAFLNRGEDTCGRRSTDCQFIVQYNGTKHHRTVLTNGENEFLYTKIIWGETVW